MKSLEIEPLAEPKYVRYAAHLRQLIEEGTLLPGDRLPSRSEVREQQQITQPTIERAQAILEREGLIVRRNRGVFVAGKDDAVESKAPANGASRVMTNVIAVVTPHERNVPSGHRQLGWSDFITQGALAACSDLGKHALIVHPNRLRGEELEHLVEHPPLGFVFSGLTKRENIQDLHWLLSGLRQKSQPVVVFGGEPEFADIDRVDSDHEVGSYLLTRHLIEMGCKKILPFWPSMANGMQWLTRRHVGYCRAMREFGLQPLAVREFPDVRLPEELDDTPEKFARTARHMAGYLADYLGRQRHCDAILAINDGEFYPMAAACRLLGHEPNRDVILAGYDNIWRDAVEHTYLPIQPVVTVDKHNWLMGRELVDLLVARTSGQLSGGPEQRLVTPELVVASEAANVASALTMERFERNLSVTLAA